MTKIEWNNCFLCLNDLSRVPDGKKRRVEGVDGKDKANLKVLFKYLLDTRSQAYDHVLQDICRALESDQEDGMEVGRGGDSSLGDSSVFSGVRLCGQCKLVATLIGDLHMQLEVVQMKIISGLKQVKEIVLTNSKVYGSNEVTRIGLEVFEDWLREQEKCGIAHPKERKMLEILFSFQTAVFEKDKESAEIPRVFLNKFSYIRPNVDNVVKTEPLDQSSSDLVDAALLALNEEEYSSRSFENYSPLEQPIVLNEKFATPSHLKKIAQERKRKNTSKMRTTIKKQKVTRNCRKVKMKKELDINNDNAVVHEDPQSQTLPLPLGATAKPKDANLRMPVRKTRIAASLASHRISEINQVSEAEIKNVNKKRLFQQKSTVNPSKSSEISWTPEENKEIRRKSNRGRRSMALPSFATNSSIKGCQKGRHRAMFTCDNIDCDYTTISAYRFEHHLRDHETGEKKFTCDRCSDNRSFSGKQLYDFHIASHNGYNRIRCDVCSRIFLALEIVEHIKTHVDKVFPCPNCSHCSSTREKYLTHLREHGTKGKLWCDLCDLIFRSRHKLLSHLYHKHKAIERITCNIDDCKKTFLDIDNLKLHQKVHTKPFVCPDCTKCFSDTSRLKIHQLTHTGERPIKCDQCSESFVNNANLQSHLIRSHGADKHKCEVCANEYSCRQSLIAHMVVHDGTGIPCGFPGCDRTFGNKTLWRRHQSFHSTEKNFVCDECGQQLKTAAKLKRHMLIHTGEKKFKCPHCEKTFLMKKYLVNHVRIHTGEKPFVCDTCGKAFNQYAALYMHKRKHLGDAAPPVNSEIGRPRVNKLEKHKNSAFHGVPTEVADVLSIESGSNPPSSSIEELQLESDTKPDMTSIEMCRERDRGEFVTGFSVIQGFSQH